VSGTRDAVVPLILARVADTPVTIPDKPAFKASEVCELMQIQPYVLRSWESEFPDLGISKTPGGPRVYRRADVERVLRIRDLVFTEGLTLSGVRRRFEAENPQPDDLFTLVASMESAPAAQPAAAPPPAGPKASTPPVAAPPVDEDTRARLGKLKQEMRSLLELLGGEGAPATPVAAPPGTGSGRRSRRA
jgi:DNA-binding transcriptional MerR regulator